MAMIHGRKTARIHEVPLGIHELGITELVGINEQVDTNDYSGSVAVTLPHASCSGEILSFLFVASETSGGAILPSAGQLLIFDADPAVASGDTALAAAGAEHKTLIGIVNVAATDWITDANGGAAFVYDQPVPFHELTTVYFAWMHKSATSINSAAGDDELLHVNAWVRLDT
jgi:hypothetical protein